MIQALRIAAIGGFALLGYAQEVGPAAKPWFIQVGANKVDSGAGGFTLVAQGGIPVYRRGLTYLGVFGGVTQWQRGTYAQSEVSAGDLLEKRTYWSGLYGGGPFLTAGLGLEYGNQETYVVPKQSNGWYDNVGKKAFGVTAFISLHGRNGFGAFLRAGTHGGFGGGLSLNF